MTEKKKTRSANIEILRILAMFMIIIYHIVRHCVKVQLIAPEELGREAVTFFNHPVFYHRLLILNTAMTFGMIGNAVFILISGYFLANREHIGGLQIGKIATKLLSQAVFATIILVCLPPVWHHFRPALFLNMENITHFNSTSWSWFVGYYFLVVLCGALFLNKFLKNFDEKQYLAFLIALFALGQFGFSGKLANSLASGLRTLLTGIFLYGLGGYIRRFDTMKNIRTYVFFVIAALVYIFVWVSGYNVTETNIETYVRAGITDPFLQTVPDYSNYSIVVIILAICLFEIFRRIHLPNSRVIAFLGQATFMVYLIHDNRMFYELWNLRDWVTTLAESPLDFMLNLLKWSGYTFAAGLMAYAAYRGVIALLKKGRHLLFKAEKTT